MPHSRKKSASLFSSSGSCWGAPVRRRRVRCRLRLPVSEMRWVGDDAPERASPDAPSLSSSVCGAWRRLGDSALQARPTPRRRGVAACGRASGYETWQRTLQALGCHCSPAVKHTSAHLSALLVCRMAQRLLAAGPSALAAPSLQAAPAVAAAATAAVDAWGGPVGRLADLRPPPGNARAGAAGSGWRAGWGHLQLATQGGRARVPSSSMRRGSPAGGRPGAREAGVGRLGFEASQDCNPDPRPPRARCVV